MKKDKNNFLCGEGRDFFVEQVFYVYQIWYIYFWKFEENHLTLSKNRIMAVLNFTSREFRSQQAHVFDLADKGEKIIIHRNKKQAYTLVPIEEDDLGITPELQARIDKARVEIKAGNCKTLKSHADIDAYFNSL